MINVVVLQLRQRRDKSILLTLSLALHFRWHILPETNKNEIGEKSRAIMQSLCHWIHSQRHIKSQPRSAIHFNVESCKFIVFGYARIESSWFIERFPSISSHCLFRASAVVKLLIASRFHPELPSPLSLSISVFISFMKNQWLRL